MNLQELKAIIDRGEDGQHQFKADEFIEFVPAGLGSALIDFWRGKWH